MADEVSIFMIMKKSVSHRWFYCFLILAMSGVFLLYVRSLKREAQEQLNILLAITLVDQTALYLRGIEQNDQKSSMFLTLEGALAENLLRAVHSYNLSSNENGRYQLQGALERAKMAFNRSPLHLNWRKDCGLISSRELDPILPDLIDPVSLLEEHFEESCFEYFKPRE